MAKVELKGIGKIYDGGVRAVTNANITIEDKEFCVFVGPSGCGKSTTLRMVAGLEDISEGKLYIDGKEMNDVPPKDRDIAMVFQNYALYPHMSVYDNMAFGLKLRKVDKAEIDRKVRAAAEQLGLTQYLQRKPKALSGGQRQRVAVGRAIVRDPKVFLFDEPLSNLDAKLRVTMRAEIASLHNTQQKTMIYVTHDQTEAMTLGTKIVVMKDGFVQQIGAPLYLYNNPINKFVAGFIGTPPMNFLTVKVLDRGGKLVCDEGSFEIEPTPAQAACLKEYVGKDVSFGIRPEDLVYSEKAVGKDNMQMKITNKEPLGAETHLYLVSNKGQQMIAKTTANADFRLGDTINMVPNMEKAKFFSKEEGEKNICDVIEVKW
ncbi:MAG: sn-glycerol-3-phosphate ABC transporter ATP-binding protein UgpC [Treponemataceae bacterium]|nr:sn-glycerol-3-phosphate ABC transporter ATP-binding protein UgpC [Treponemataceae bacterium]